MNIIFISTNKVNTRYNFIDILKLSIDYLLIMFITHYGEKRDFTYLSAYTRLREVLLVFFFFLLF